MPEQYVVEAAERLQVPPVTLVTFTKEQIALLEAVLKDLKSPKPKYKAMLEAMFLQGPDCGSDHAILLKTLS